MSFENDSLFFHETMEWSLPIKVTMGPLTSGFFLRPHKDELKDQNQFKVCHSALSQCPVYFQR